MGSSCEIEATKKMQIFYSVVFKAVFNQCKDTEFVVGNNLKRILLDWSDAKRKELQLALGEEL